MRETSFGADATPSAQRAIVLHSRPTLPMLFASFALGVMLPTQPLGRRLGAASPKVVLEAYVDCEPTALPSATLRAIS